MKFQGTVWRTAQNSTLSVLFGVTTPNKPNLEKIQLAGFSLDVDYYLTESYDDISVAMEELPPVLEWINERLSSLIEQRGVKSQELKTVEARVYMSLKQGGLGELYPGVKPTEEAVKHAINLDKSVIRVNDEYSVVDGWVNRLRGIQSSFSAKLELLRSSEATRRRVFETTE